MTESDDPQFIQIYLFDSSGNFYWCNGSADLDIENQGVLHAGLFATLYRFSRETLGEKLNYLLINELRINIFELLDKYLVAIVTPKFLHVDPRQITIIKTRIKQVLNEREDSTTDDLTSIIVRNLNQLLEELFHWLDRYVGQANRAMNLFTRQIEEIEKMSVGVFLYTWDANRVFKYVPSSNVLDFQIEELIDSASDSNQLLTNLHRSYLIQNNTIVYFHVSDLILILTKSFETGKIDESVEQIMESTGFFERIVDQIMSPKDNRQGGQGLDS